MAQMKSAEQMKTTKSKLTSDLAPLDKQVVIEDTILPMNPVLSVLCAKMGQGKSTLLINMLGKKSSPYYKFFDHIYLMSPTASADDKFLKLVHELDNEEKFYSVPSEENLQEIIHKCETNLERWLEKGRPKNDLNQAIIIDDSIHLIKQKKLPSLDILATTLRHKRCWVFVCTQKFNTYLPTIVRNNMSCFFCWRTENQHELKTIIEEIGCHKEKFMSAYNYATQKPFNFLYVKMNPTCTYYHNFDKINFE